LDFTYCYGVPARTQREARAQEEADAADDDAQLDRYISARRLHKMAHLDALWLGQRAPVTDSGISQIVEKRALQAGMDGLHPQQLHDV
jgi:hypothetical protein